MSKQSIESKIQVHFENSVLSYTCSHDQGWYTLKYGIRRNDVREAIVTGKQVIYSCTAFAVFERWSDAGVEAERTDGVRLSR